MIGGRYVLEALVRGGNGLCSSPIKLEISHSFRSSHFRIKAYLPAFLAMSVSLSMAQQINELRHLGRNGPMVPSIGFGLMSLSGAYGAPPSDEERFKLLDRAFELGETFWDTSEYANLIRAITMLTNCSTYGDNEDMLGKWFKKTGKWDQIFLASKFGIIRGAGLGFKIDSSAEYCKQASRRASRDWGWTVSTFVSQEASDASRLTLCRLRPSHQSGNTN